MVFPGGPEVKESACKAPDAGDTDSIPGLGRSLGGGNGNPFQYSCPENSVDRGAWQAAIHLRWFVEESLEMIELGD